MKLPDLSPSAHPEFVDAATCKAWLEQVPLANVASAQQELIDEIGELNRFPTGSANRLAAMEALREAVNFVQVEQAKRFMNRPLPLAEAEASIFQGTCHLWEQMRLGYLRCLDAALHGDPSMRSAAAIITQRLGAYSGLKMFHHYRAYREVPPGDWASLHEVYAAAEQLGVEEEPVKDFLNRDVQDSSPRIAYVRALLMGLCAPYELTQRQLTFVAFLLERWANKVEISGKSVPSDEPGVPPLVVDLTSQRPPERLAPEASKGSQPRFLDTRKLAKSLRNRIGLLRKGESPAKLALGEDCVQPSCEQLLVFLFRQWCQSPPARGKGGGNRVEPVELCAELAGIHRELSGGTVRRQVTGGTDLTQKQRQELETLGHIRSEEAAPGTILEAWQLELDSAPDLRLRRAGTPSGRRYSHGQLVAIRSTDAKSFVLGHIRWLVCAANGSLLAGVKVMPGSPTPISLRPVGLNEKDAPVPSLCLGAGATADASQSLVMPYGSFKPKRLLETESGAPGKIRLLAVLERGVDYERVSFEPA